MPDVARPVQFGRDHVGDPEEDWDNVMWLDETKTESFGKNSIRVWRKKTAEWHLKNAIPSVKRGGGNIMLWGFHELVIDQILILGRNFMNKLF